ncbi:ATP-binding protein [Ruficoccus amylovorans]|uniref:ATP-binding protein n=1 Tax=Ruficoccus amylovorans TaxID=1804625 RepID=A0A842HBK3_9BACT|nr:ATP-binding protein [Ruficoccus amylovorans]MBC2593539.1 ATP-binding protein [Ruficoccus amylovorans]
MDDITFRRLLYEEESVFLDFKCQQYPFKDVSDTQKSELLKDILGFCNARRPGLDAYILIGVKEIRGGQSEVVGIAECEHLSDNDIQQFVNTKTNRPVHFRYEAYCFSEKQVGVIVIAEQQRPIYLKKDYGKLKRDCVYVRRGSSTDPSHPASPDEIALMGSEKSTPNTKIDILFAEPDYDVSIGLAFPLRGEYCQMPDDDDIPLIEPRATTSTYGGLTFDLGNAFREPINSEFYRELAYYEYVRRLFRPVRLSVQNTGEVSAKNVRVEIVLADDDGVFALDECEVPERPRRKGSFISTPVIGAVGAAIRREPGIVEISTKGERTSIEINCYDLQPGRQVWSEVFYIGTRNNGVSEINGKVYADSLSKPAEFRLTVQAEIQFTQMTVDELRSLNVPERDYTD